jgi:hypothetical protein
MYVAKSFYADAREGAYVCVALGGFRKRAVDIAVTSIALIVPLPILLATAGLVRLLVGKAVFEVDKRIGFGVKRLLPNRSILASEIMRIHRRRSGSMDTLGLRASAVHCARQVSTGCRFCSISCAVI